ncbi:MAG: S9 family peptidase [Candidatus Cyclobacteriaceae bacterium M3_2C_046]
MTKLTGYKLYIILNILGLIHMHVLAQDKQEITLEEIYINGDFYENKLSELDWMNRGPYYTNLEYNRETGASFIYKYDISTGEKQETLFDSEKIKIREGNYNRLDTYELSPNEDKILLSFDQESIYRWSTKAFYLVYNLNTQQIQPINQDLKISNASFSPDGSKVAYIKANDLFYFDLESEKEIQITEDGQLNKIINGMSDWVYEEEFGFTKAYKWSPDSRSIAYYRFDESAVNHYNLQIWGGLYPENYVYKYPKAGEQNSEVTIWVYHLKAADKVQVELGQDYEYVAQMQWTSDPDQLMVVTLNRLQNHLSLLHANSRSGDGQVILEETSPTYVDIEFNNTFIYLPENKGFLRTSEQDGFKHIYHYDMQGQLKQQVTDGTWEVDEFYGYDPVKQLIYYNSTEVSPLERHLYTIQLNGKKKRKLTESPGVNKAEFSPDFSHYILRHTAIKQPQTVTLHAAPSGRQLVLLEDNQQLKQKIDHYQYGQVEFFQFENEENTSLNGYMIKPYNFNENQEYPVLMYVYGGPGSVEVLNDYGRDHYMWHHYLSQLGYIIVAIDNRGTAGRGWNFKHKTYAQLGKLEVEDQIAGAKYLATLPYVDQDRIGIWGWSYGGFLSSLAITMGADYFNAAIAVAPVTSWIFYDTIYTERYMQTPELNPEGYEDYSPISHAYKLEDPYLLIHGTGDDNVHFQHTIEMQNALIAANKQFDSFFYPDQDHSINYFYTRYHLYSMMTNFVLENI